MFQVIDMFCACFPYRCRPPGYLTMTRVSPLSVSPLFPLSLPVFDRPLKGVCHCVCV
jgi:hypothetical protein